MSDEDKQARDDLSDLLPKNANIGVVGIAVDGGIGVMGTSGSPIIGIASTGGSDPKVNIQAPEEADGDK